MNSAHQPVEQSTAENRPMKRVAIIGRLYNPGGVQSVILSLVRGLNRLGIQPDLIWDIPFDARLLKERGVEANFQYIRFPVPSKVTDALPPTVRYILRVPNLLTEKQLDKQYDFIYIFYNGFVVTNGVPHVRYLSGPPLLPQLDLAGEGPHGRAYRFFQQVYRKLLRSRFPVYEYHRDSRYVINSEFTAQLFEEAHGVQLQVVHPPIDLSGRSFVPGDSATRDTITFFSRFANYKRPDMVLSLAEHHPDWRFVMMGGVNPQQVPLYQSLVADAQARGLGNVTFYENPSNATIREELARTRVYVFPGVNEHFGMATAEAIASGAIPYVHDSGGQREVVPDIRLRFTDDCFFEKFTQILNFSPETQKEIQLRLRDHVDGFSENAFIEKMTAFLE